MRFHYPFDSKYLVDSGSGTLHVRLHDIDATSDHNGVSGATENNFISFDANGLPKDSGKNDSSYAAAAHLHDGDTLQCDGVNSDGGAFSFTTSGAVTFNQDVTANDLTVSTPSNVYALSHDSFADFVANEHIDWTNSTSAILAGNIRAYNTAAATTLTVESGTSTSVLSLKSAANDAYIVMDPVVGGNVWSFGEDYSDSGSFVISDNATPGTNNRLKITPAGAVSIPGTLAVTGTAEVGHSIADNKVVTIDDADAADDDFAKFTANGIEGRSYAEVKSDLSLEVGTDVLAQQTIGIADNNLLEVDDADAADDDFAKFTANGLEGRSYAEVRSDINVEDGADVTDWTNVAAALAAATGNVDVNGQAITNVGNVDGRDVSADGSSLDTLVAWQPGALEESIMNAQGDLITATADNSPTILSVGNDADLLIADSAQGGGLVWAAMSGDVTITKAGVATIGANKIDGGAGGGMLEGGIIHDQTATTTIADADELLVDDGANDTLRKITRSNLFGGASKIMFPGGVYLFIQDATPTANAADDLWWETDTNILWFWNGTYWLSTQLFQMHAHLGEAEASSNNQDIGYWTTYTQNATDHDYYFEDYVATTVVSTTNDGSNYWTFYFQRYEAGVGATSILTWNTSSDTKDVFNRRKGAIGTHIDASSISDERFRLRMQKTNSPGAVKTGQTFNYRWAHT